MGFSKSAPNATNLAVPDDVEELQAEVSLEKSRRFCLHRQLHKTKFCTFHLKGVCHYGSDCSFAHSCVDLQVSPDLRKTRLCTSFLEGQCDDPECSFAHGDEDLVSTGMFHKRSLCKWNEKGKCRPPGLSAKNDNNSNSNSQNLWAKNDNNSNNNNSNNKNNNTWGSQFIRGRQTTGAGGKSLPVQEPQPMKVSAPGGFSAAAAHGLWQQQQQQQQQRQQQQRMALSALWQQGALDFPEPLDSAWSDGGLAAFSAAAGLAGFQRDQLEADSRDFAFSEMEQMRLHLAAMNGFGLKPSQHSFASAPAAFPSASGLPIDAFSAGGATFPFASQFMPSEHQANPFMPLVPATIAISKPDTWFRLR
ncbi:unnamed protein product [Polarella glacialis]|uniref:C3H1-type domain-containing protein n=1 Tax=Polarella glacialis TaxID=89957 RepID=A0A813EUL1_POLGL|nr:unnamed protein product [Polarella glacialis]